MLINFLAICPNKIKSYQSLLFFADENIYTDLNQGTNLKYISICDRNAIELMKKTTITIGIIIIFMAIYLCFPIFDYFVNNDLQFPVPILLPFTNLKSMHGIILNILNQMFIVLVGTTGNIGIEIITCLLKDTIKMSTIVICQSIDELSEFIEKSKSDDENYIDHQYRNILIQVQDLNR